MIQQKELKEELMKILKKVDNKCVWEVFTNSNKDNILRGIVIYRHEYKQCLMPTIKPLK